MESARPSVQSPATGTQSPSASDAADESEPPAVVVGLDVGGTKTNATVIDEFGNFLVDTMVEVPSRVTEGPDEALDAMQAVIDKVLAVVGVDERQIRAIGLDTPGPASAQGVIASAGATNFSQEQWWGFDIRSAVETRFSLPVIYNNDGNAAALYAHSKFFGDDGDRRSSVAAIVGTGLGGGVIEQGRVVKGTTGMAGELGHVYVPMHELLGEGQPLPRCNCGFVGDVESVASLTGIRHNLLPYWLTRYPDHPLASLPVDEGAKAVRGYGEAGDEMALQIFEQQAAAIGGLFTIMANVTDPDVYFVGGGVTEAAPHFRDWFLERVRANTRLRSEQATVSSFELVTDLDMAGARGAAIAALHAIRP